MSQGKADQYYTPLPPTPKTKSISKLCSVSKGISLIGVDEITCNEFIQTMGLDQPAFSSNRYFNSTNDFDKSPPLKCTQRDQCGR
jgi:hypothetical protein